MRAYFYPDTREIWATYSGPVEIAPAGDFIEVAEDAMPRGQEFYLVDEDLQLVPRYNVDALRRAINDERDRRLGEGAVFTFQGHAFQFDPDARENIQGVHSLATAAVFQNGAARDEYYWHGLPTPFAFIAADNTPVLMDAPTVMEFGTAAAFHKQAVMRAARVLKDAAEIPENFADDEFWP